MTKPLIPDTYTACAVEGDVCPVPSNVPTIVGYTTVNEDADIYFRDVKDPIECKTGIFGDPAPFVAKKCLKLPFPEAMLKLAYDPVSGLPVESLGFKHCAHAGAICDPSRLDPSVSNKPVDIMYGAEGKYTYAQIIGPVNCTDTVFGDPAPYKAKKCLWRIPPSTSPITPPTPSPPPPTPSPSPPFTPPEPEPPIISPPKHAPPVPPKSKIGLILGLVFGFILLIIIIVIIIFIMKKKSKKSK